MSLIKWTTLFSKLSCVKFFLEGRRPPVRAVTLSWRPETREVLALVPLCLMAPFKGVIVVPSGVIRQHPYTDSGRLTVTYRLTVLLIWTRHNYWPAFHATQGPSEASFCICTCARTQTHTRADTQRERARTVAAAEWFHDSGQQEASGTNSKVFLPFTTSRDNDV